MYIEIMPSTSCGKDGREAVSNSAVVRWDGDGSIADIAQMIAERGLKTLAFVDKDLFSDHDRGIALCREMCDLNINVLWTASLTAAPKEALLEAMRLAGCQRLVMFLEPDAAVGSLAAAREFGFDICIRNVDGTPYACDRTQYSVAEREAIVDRLPGVHAVQFDLAVAYFKARRFSDVMLPLGKAMTMRYPMNELCLNLLACLSAAKHYPDMAAGLLEQAGHGTPHPVVFRNRGLLKSWLQSGGDVKGVRLLLEPEHRGGL